MADFAFQRETRTQGQTLDRVFLAGEEAEFIFGMGTQLFPNAPVALWGNTVARTVEETDAKHFEIGFKIDTQLDGNAATGFTDSGNYFRIEIQQSTDLVNWNMGRFVPAPVPVVNNGDGTWTYWCRSTQPIWYYNIYVDLTATSNRYGKSITDIQIGMVTIPLAYPYAMPSQAAALQSALIAAGYTGSIVSSVAAPLSVGIVNHTINGRLPLGVTMSGTDVTMVKTNTGTNISLPSYPYSMPSQRATLQTDLRAAGQSGAVVMLYGDEWTLFIPDRLAATPLQRQFALTITPDDPYPAWDMLGAYLGNQPAAGVSGTAGNVRPGIGQATTPEALRQFARLKISNGSRYNHLMP